ncbi:hypothetical protein AAFF_G00290480 [Aldrovandia affinis]|uniref:Uncharacterized protein n=1 Tax=Aldrovandia affinis TaxID=143900 RepID=A0AAD7W1L6_9TELE|nr:hypothetical protein AAFF_G00290480 [Aldrovandia affinis]
MSHHGSLFPSPAIWPELVRPRPGLGAVLPWSRPSVATAPLSSTTQHLMGQRRPAERMAWVTLVALCRRLIKWESRGSQRGAVFLCSPLLAQRPAINQSQRCLARPSAVARSVITLPAPRRLRRCFQLFKMAALPLRVCSLRSGKSAPEGHTGNFNE